MVFALNQTLTHQDNALLGIKSSSSSSSAMDVTTDDLIEQYRRGNLDSRYFNQDTFQIPSNYMAGGDDEGLSARDRQMSNEIDEYFRDNLIRKRNKRMAARVIDLLVNQPDSYFFAFGAGHFVGEESILDFVRSAGFVVDRLGPADRLSFGSSSLNPGKKHRIKGTFDDLPDEEKTKALLQFLQYKERLEREEREKASSPPVQQQHESADEKAVEESIKVWYGLEGGGSSTLRSFSAWRLFCFCILTGKIL